MPVINYIKKMLKKKVKAIGINTTGIETKTTETNTIEYFPNSHSSLYTVEDNTSDYYNYKYLYD